MRTPERPPLLGLAMALTAFILVYFYAEPVGSNTSVAGYAIRSASELQDGAKFLKNVSVSSAKMGYQFVKTSGDVMMGLRHEDRGIFQPMLDGYFSFLKTLVDFLDAFRDIRRTEAIIYLRNAMQLNMVGYSPGDYRGGQLWKQSLSILGSAGRLVDVRNLRVAYRNGDRASRAKLFQCAFWAFYVLKTLGHYQKTRVGQTFNMAETLALTGASGFYSLLRLLEDSKPVFQATYELNNKINKTNTIHANSLGSPKIRQRTGNARLLQAPQV